MNPTTIGLKLAAVSKTYPGGNVGIDGVDLDLESGELLAVVGPSGSGKTTLLRAVAGLEPIDRGEIRIDGRRVDGLSPSERGVSLVFQNQAPYPHLSVFENLAFGFRARRRSASEIAERVAEVAAALRLESLVGRMPSTLSGGEKQRVALGRALATRPSLLLLDEPFSNLDAPLRASARDDLIRWQVRWGVTTLIVTHDQAEALANGDRVALMDGGKIVQIGPPRELYDRPATLFVGQFLGSPPLNLIPAEVVIEGDHARIRILGAEAEASTIVPMQSGESWGFADAEPRRIDLGIRPEHLAIRPLGSTISDKSRLTVACWVDRLEFRGDQAIAHLRSGTLRIAVRIQSSTRFGFREMVAVEIDPARVVAFEPQSGVRIELPWTSMGPSA